MATKSNSKSEVQQETSIGFGVKPNDSQHHFAILPRLRQKDVAFFEFLDYDPIRDEDALQYSLGDSNSPCKCLLPKLKWDMISVEVRNEFNKRLREMKQPNANYSPKGFSYFHRLLGKELLVLAWAIEDADPGTIGLAIQNWLGLRPEERWWLYTITNAATGHALNGKGKGWRRALRYALTENPVVGGRIDLNIVNDHSLPGLFGEPMTFYNS